MGTGGFSTAAATSDNVTSTLSSMWPDVVTVPSTPKRCADLGERDIARMDRDELRVERGLESAENLRAGIELDPRVTPEALLKSKPVSVSVASPLTRLANGKLSPASMPLNERSKRLRASASKAISAPSCARPP